MGEVSAWRAAEFGYLSDSTQARVTHVLHQVIPAIISLASEERRLIRGQIPNVIAPHTG